MRTSEWSNRLVSRRRFAIAGVAGVLLAACGAPPEKGPPTTAPAAPPKPTEAAAAPPKPTEAAAAAKPTQAAAATTAPAQATTAPAQAAATKPAEAAKPAAPAPAPTATIAVSEIGAGQKEITFWHGFGGPDGKTMTELLKQYVEQAPEFKVHQESMDWGIFYQKFPTAIIAGTPPDLAINHIWAIAQIASRGLLRPVDDLYADKGLPRNDFIRQVIDGLTYNGKAQGVPLNAFGWGAYVNTATWKKAGLDATTYNPDKPFPNGDEFVKVARQLTTDKSGRHPGDSGFDEKNVAIWAIDVGASRQTFLTTIWQFGGSIISEDGKKATVNQEPVAQAIQYWYDAIHKHKIAPLPVGFDAATAYANGGLGIWMNGSWQKGFVNDHPDLLPPVTKIWFSPQWGTKPATFASAHILVLPKQQTGQRLDDATKLIIWLANHSQLWGNGGMLPPRSSLIGDPKIKDDWHTGPFSRMFETTGRIEEANPNVTQIQDAYQPAFISVLTNQKPLKGALNEANDRIQRILDSAPTK